MKTAIYIENGLVQLVLTGENEFEKNTIRMFEKQPIAAKIFYGSFYDCRGGWTRQEEVFPNTFGGGRSTGDHSLILRVTPAPAETNELLFVAGGQEA